jgi:hypothetical protein
VVAQARAAAASAPPALGPDAEALLLQRQATGRQALAALGGIIERNQQLAATLSAAGGAAPVPAPAAAAPPGAGPGRGLGAASPPASLSPSRDTPLANYFASASASVGNSGPLDGAAGGAPLSPPLGPGGARPGCYSPLTSAGLGIDLPGLMLDAPRRASGGALAPPAAAAGAQGAGGAPRPLNGAVPHMTVSLPLA